MHLRPRAHQARGGARSTRVLGADTAAAALAVVFFGDLASTAAVTAVKAARATAVAVASAATAGVMSGATATGAADAAAAAVGSATAAAAATVATTRATATGGTMLGHRQDYPI